MNKASGLFAILLIVMWLSYAQGTFDPANRVIVGPVTLLQRSSQRLDPVTK